jgi:hypothetical protein
LEATVKAITQDMTVAAGRTSAAEPVLPPSVGVAAGLDDRIVYRRLVGSSLPWSRSAKPTAVTTPGGPILAKLTDGPLSGSTREVVAVEGRPPKTIDIEVADGSVRYCLAEWEQAGHSATYGFLYEV